MLTRGCEPSHTYGTHGHVRVGEARPYHCASVPQTSDRYVYCCFPSQRGGFQGYDISFAVTEDHDVLSWGAKGTGATGHRLGTGAFDDDDEDLYKEPRPIRDLVGEEVCQVKGPCLGYSFMEPLAEHDEPRQRVYGDPHMFGSTAYVVHERNADDCCAVMIYFPMPGSKVEDRLANSVEHAMQYLREAKAKTQRTFKKRRIVFCSPLPQHSHQPCTNDAMLRQARSRLGLATAWRRRKGGTCTFGGGEIPGSWGLEIEIPSRFLLLTPLSRRVPRFLRRVH